MICLVSGTSIRNAQGEENRAVSRWIANVRASAPKIRIAQFREEAGFTPIHSIPKYFRCLRNAADIQSFAVVTADLQPVAALIVFPQKIIHALEIEHISVGKGWRGPPFEIARSLILFCEGYMKTWAKAFDRIVLWVATNNARAIRAYEDAGFVLKPEAGQHEVPSASDPETMVKFSRFERQNGAGFRERTKRLHPKPETTATDPTTSSAAIP
eukprot:962738_1